jgi:acyl-CoA dehydrogenase family member 9
LKWGYRSVRESPAHGTLTVSSTRSWRLATPSGQGNLLHTSIALTPDEGEFQQLLPQTPPPPALLSQSMRATSAVTHEKDCLERKNLPVWLRFGFARIVSEASFMKSLFFGSVAEGMLFPFPAPSPREGEKVHALLTETKRYFEKNVNSAEIDRTAEIPAAVFEGLAGLGLAGISIPESYGGLGFSHTATARVIQEIASLDPAIAVALGAHATIGLRGIIRFGSDELKAKYLPSVARGERWAAFALSEANAGSDAGAIRTHAEDVSGAYLLRGQKAWVANARESGLVTVFARTSAPDADAKPRITAFLLDRSSGYAVGPSEAKLGIRGVSTAEIRFDETRVEASHVIHEVGRGFKVAMEVLNDGRLGLAAGCIGMAKRLVRLSIERATSRRAFGRAIGDFGLIKDKIAHMMSNIYALECMTYLTTGLVDSGVSDYSLESAACKVFASETLWSIANETLEIAAGAGYMSGPPYERLLRDARVNLIFTGTNEILRCFIALSGMQAPGKEIVDVAKAVREPIKGFGLLSDFALRRARSALGRERLLRGHALLSKEAAVVDHYAQDLARNVEKVLRKHGRNIAEMQYTQMRVANMAIDLYALSSVVSRATRALELRGEEGARRDIDLATIFGSLVETRLAQTSAAFDKNDDELRKGVASRAYADGGYPLDII